MSMMIPCVKGPIYANVRIPGSKSITNRALLLAALAEGDSVLENVLFSDDTIALINALRGLNVSIAVNYELNQVKVSGCSGKFPCNKAQINCWDAGTIARFLLAACANQLGEFLFDGSLRLRQRPLGDLIEVLREQGAIITENSLPLTIKNSHCLRGGEIFIASDVSSQFLSGLLMISPYLQQDVCLTTRNLVSQPYVDMTIAMMHDFGAEVKKNGYAWQVSIEKKYQARSYWIESDFSSASYFFAAAAVTRGEVVVHDMSYEKSIQGDKKFLDVLQEMGCLVQTSNNKIKVQGPKKLKGVTIDMRDFSDTMMTLAAISPFADSPTRILNVGNTRVKESDRISAMTNNLRRSGVRVDEEKTALTIYPGLPHAGVIASYDDHRIAMACALIGLKVPGIEIDNIECVSKTFPKFFEIFFGMYC